MEATSLKNQSRKKHPNHNKSQQTNKESERWMDSKEYKTKSAIKNIENSYIPATTFK